MTQTPADRTRPPGSPSAGAPFPETAGGAEKNPGRGAWLLALLAPLACCGLPLLILAGAAAGWAVVGWIGGGIAAVAVVGAAALWLRRRRAGTCCPPERPTDSPW